MQLMKKKFIQMAMPHHVYSLTFPYLSFIRHDVNISLPFALQVAAAVLNIHTMCYYFVDYVLTQQL